MTTTYLVCLDLDSAPVCLSVPGPGDGCRHLPGNANNLLLIKTYHLSFDINLPGAHTVFVFCLSDSPPFSGHHPSSFQPPIKRAKWDTITYISSRQWCQSRDPGRDVRDSSDDPWPWYQLTRGNDHLQVRAERAECNFNKSINSDSRYPSQSW